MLTRHIEPTAGIEPATFSLRKSCTEPLCYAGEHFEQVTEIESVYSRRQRDASPVGLTCKFPIRFSVDPKIAASTFARRATRRAARVPFTSFVGVTRIALATSWSQTTRSAG